MVPNMAIPVRKVMMKARDTFLSLKITNGIMGCAAFFSKIKNNTSEINDITNKLIIWIEDQAY